MSAHTPGPWTAEGLLVLAGDRALTVAACKGYQEGPANARLSAAAPDLLIALRAFLREATRYHTDCGHGLEGAAAECDSICECIPVAKAAIAKAGGPS